MLKIFNEKNLRVRSSFGVLSEETVNTLRSEMTDFGVATDWNIQIFNNLKEKFLLSGFRKEIRPKKVPQLIWKLINKEKVKFIVNI